MNEIDLLRFVAAMAVVFYHYAFRGFAGGDRTTLAYPLLESIAKYGFMGVELFFMISGFVILMTAANGSLRKFVVSRIARLYPAFWVCCSLTFLAILLIGAPHFSATFVQYLVNMTMLNGFVRVASIDGVYWSLFVEIQFYAMVSLVLMLGLIGRVQALLLGWLAATIVLAFLPMPLPMLRLLLIADYAPYFIAGAVCYLVWSSGASAARWGMLAACLGMALRDALGGLPLFEQRYDTRMNRGAVVAIIMSYFAVMAMVALRWTGPLARRRWLLAGALTYPLYLLHQNIGYMIFNLAGPVLDPHLLFWGTLSLMLLASWLVHVHVERRLSGPLMHACDEVVGEGLDVLGSMRRRR
ncbi:acyltransferase family protein [Marilutibacter aestuarii]|nr:acyltransferase [Lysobacter aestuarii]